jgi:hypothetical protein
MFEFIKDALAVIGLVFIVLTFDANVTKFSKWDEDRAPDF